MFAKLLIGAFKPEYSWNLKIFCDILRSFDQFYPRMIPNLTTDHLTSASFRLSQTIQAWELFLVYS